MNLFRKTTKYLTDKLLTNFKKQLEKQILIEYDDVQGNLILERLIEREPPERLRTLLFKKVFPLDFKDVPEERRRFEVYARIAKATSILDLFRSRYTRTYEAFVQAKTDEEREQLKGRILECSNIIDQALLAPNVLADWDNYQEKLSERNKKISKYLTKNNE